MCRMLHFSDLTYTDLTHWLEVEGCKPVHAAAIWDGFYRSGKTDFQGSGLPSSLSCKMSQAFSVTPVLSIDERLKSTDGTEKFLFRCLDGQLIEAVFIPQGKRKTLCISSQVGCPFACRFCATGAIGFRRNLTTAEIVFQIVEAQRALNTRITNVVFMGMGEPLANLEAVQKSMEILAHPLGLAVPPRRITLSTLGLLSPLQHLLDKPFRFSLAISLHHPDRLEREQLMPGTVHHDLGQLMTLLRGYTESSPRTVLFEYLLLGGINDSLDHAKALINLLSGIRSRVNLISFHPFDGSPFQPSTSERERAFYHHLQQAGVSALFRKSRGQDILAACGQLAGLSRSVFPVQGSADG
jgi:23S rRNA (adenine2503-C2)-methyltransferase